MSPSRDGRRGSARESCKVTRVSLTFLLLTACIPALGRRAVQRDAGDGEVLAGGSSTRQAKADPVAALSRAAEAAAARGWTATPSSLADRGLLSENIDAAPFLVGHNTYHGPTAGVKTIAGETLGYVTPWNSGGYDFARLFAGKLDYVSPTWFQFREGDDGKLALTGGHDVDLNWIADLRAAGSSGGSNACTVADAATAAASSAGTCTARPLIVPRVVAELKRGALAPSELIAMGDLLAAEAARSSFDGFVLELPMLPLTAEILTAAQRSHRRRHVQGGGEGTAELIFILVVPPGGQMPPNALAALDSMVHRYSLMTYDYAAHGRAGAGGADGVPNAPIGWVKQAVRQLAASLPSGSARKILVGLPFYGYGGGKPLLAQDFVALLRGKELEEEGEEGSLRWNDEAAELFARRSDGRLVTFPTPAFLAARVAAAADAGAGGIAVWELGQGLPMFADVL